METSKMYLWLWTKGGYTTPEARKKAEKLSHDEIRSIALIRHGAIGDQVVLRPLLREMRELFPNATLTLSLIDSYQYGAPIDLVDRVHVVYKKRDGKKTSSLDRFRQIKALGEHDIIIDLCDSALSMWIVLFNKAKFKMGYPYRAYRKLLFNIVLQRSDLFLETENMLHFAYVFGARGKRPYDYAFPKYIKDTEHPYICYFFSASMQNKCWPKDSFVSLIGKMAERYPMYTHVLMDGIGAHEKSDDMIALLSKYSNVAKQTPLDLDHVFPFLGQSSMVIANDTGVRNMTIAVNAPTLGIFNSTSLFRYWPRDTIHDIVFDKNGGDPSVEMVFDAAVKHLEWLESK